jgi:hypothetical protein
MSLRVTAEKDLAHILENDTAGFRWSIAVTDPNSVQVEMFGFSNDIAAMIDPETGLLVQGRTASVALRVQSLLDNFAAIPVGVHDRNSKPWLVAFDDINGQSYTFKVFGTNPDRSLGLITCTLEPYT